MNYQTYTLEDGSEVSIPSHIYGNLNSLVNSYPTNKVGEAFGDSIARAFEELIDRIDTQAADFKELETEYSRYRETNGVDAALVVNQRAEIGGLTRKVERLEASITQQTEAYRETVRRFTRVAEEVVAVLAEQDLVTREGARVTVDNILREQDLEHVIALPNPVVEVEVPITLHLIATVKIPADKGWSVDDLTGEAVDNLLFPSTGGIADARAPFVSVKPTLSDAVKGVEVTAMELNDQEPLYMVVGQPVATEFQYPQPEPGLVDSDGKRLDLDDPASGYLHGGM